MVLFQLTLINRNRAITIEAKLKSAQRIIVCKLAVSIAYEMILSIAGLPIKKPAQTITSL
jgi:hypothetical protein